MVLKKSYSFHILIWTAMLIYVVAAPAVYARFILQDGRSISLDQEIPPSTEHIKYSVDHLGPIILHGNKIFQILGWSFIQDEVDQSVYERFFVLQSDTRTYLFLTETRPLPDVPSAFNNLDLDLTNSGMRTYIAKDVVQRGTYHIGILFRHKLNSQMYYVETNKDIERTANELTLSQ